MPDQAEMSVSEYLNAMWTNESPVAVLAAALADAATSGPAGMLKEETRKEVGEFDVYTVVRVAGHSIAVGGSDLFQARLALRQKLIELADHWAGEPLTC